jgi:hypothetical protein
VIYYETRHIIEFEVPLTRDKKIKTVKALTWTILSSLIVLAAFSEGAYGITGNTQTDTPPYVCVVVLFGPDQISPIGYCSGVLISSNVVLTAGHCTINAAAASVCFDKGPIKYSIVEGSIVYSGTTYDGTPYTFPEYKKAINSELPKGSHLFANSDIGIVVLDAPIDIVDKFPELPDVGLVETLGAKTYLKVIGYGVQSQVTPRNAGVQNSWTETISCNSAQTQLISGNFAGSDKYLRLTANPSQNKGGIAFGDSGGPVLYQADDNTVTVLAINAYASNLNCAGVSYHTRIDTEQVLGWIASGVYA